MDKTVFAKDLIVDGNVGPNNNILVLGGTGTGKTISCLLPTLYNTEESSFIATFAKKTLVQNAVAYFKKRGYKTFFWNLSNPDQSDRLPDLLQYAVSENDTQELARQIVRSNPDYNNAHNFDPYWLDAAETLLTGLMEYEKLTKHFPKMKRVIDTFYKLEVVQDGYSIVTSMEEAFQDLKMRYPNSLAAKKLLSFKMLPYRTAACVRDSLEKSIQTAFPTSIQNSMNENSYVDFSKFATEKTAIFILTSPTRVSQYAFSNIIFNIAIRSLLEFAEKQPDNKLPRPVKLYFDDFSCGFPISNFDKTISTFREEAGISALMNCQSLSQLYDTYGADKAHTIQDNCSSMVYFPGGLNRKTAMLISEMSNLPIEDVLFCPVGKVFVLRSGEKPIFAPRFETFKDPLYREFMNSQKSIDEIIT